MWKCLSSFTIAIVLALSVQPAAAKRRTKNGAKNSQTLAKVVVGALKAGSIDKVLAVQVSPDAKACASTQHFKMLARDAIDKTRRKFKRCVALGLVKGRQIGVKRIPNKPRPLHKCTEYKRTHDLRVSFEMPDKRKAYLMIDDVVVDSKGRHWIGDDIYCRRVIPLPPELLKAVSAYVAKACRCKTKACYEAVRAPKDTAAKKALSLVIGKGYDGTEMLKIMRPLEACEKRLK